MNDSVRLIGVEEVQRAALTIDAAAESMQRTMMGFSHDVDRLVRALDEHAARIEHALENKP